MDAEAQGKAGMTSSQAAAILTVLRPTFLEGLNPVEVRSILAAARRRRFEANSVITSEGDPADRLFLMLDGGARFYTLSPGGKKVVVRWIRPGELVGGASLLTKPLELVLSAEAVRNSSALVWDRATIRSFVARYPRLLENAMLLAYDYLVHYRILHVAISTQSAPQRLAQVLGYLAKEMGERVPGGVELRVSNEGLAHEANVTIFTVSRLMGEWQRKGLLRKSRGKVVLRLPEELIRLGD
jgi:CRP/FNR family transcriptional regulator, nitrogen oxide reductase regulator